MPHAVGARRDFLEAAPGRDAVGLLLDDGGAAIGAREVVLFLDEEPGLAFAVAVLAAADAHEVPRAVELLAVQLELEPALAVALVRVGLRHPDAAVPEHDRAGAVLPG